MVTISPLEQTLAPAAVEGVLGKLGLSARPDPDPAGLAALYSAWCQRVPFDNVRKLLHLRCADPGPLPGDSAADFFAGWLREGAGGTCWAGNGALQTLLRALGFAADRGLATMLVAPNVPPNHGTVVVRLEGRTYLVDASMLFGQPLELDERTPQAICHGAWGVESRLHEGRWMIRWRPLHMSEGMDCRIERLQTSAQSFHDRHEASRPWSPFNYSLYARRNRADRALGIAFGERVDLLADGTVGRGPLTAEARARFLIDELGMREALVARLPQDLPLPPAPGSNSARRAGER